MKTVTVEEVENNFPALLRIVQRGEELNVVSRRKRVARIIPVQAVVSGSRPSKKRKLAWADHFTKLDAIFQRKPAPGKAGSQIITEGRR